MKGFWLNLSMVFFLSLAVFSGVARTDEEPPPAPTCPSHCQSAGTCHVITYTNCKAYHCDQANDPTCRDCRCDQFLWWGNWWCMCF